MTENTSEIAFLLNGKEARVQVESRTLLADCLRHQLGLTGTHLGCEHGVCGACTVRVNGDAVRSCLMFAIQVDDASVETVEGLAADDRLHPAQAGFQAEHGLQCGFCTPGLLMSTVDLLEANPDPSEEEIREHISGNICRCTGYGNIIRAIQHAAQASAADR